MDVQLIFVFKLKFVTPIGSTLNDDETVHTRLRKQLQFTAHQLYTFQYFAMLTIIIAVNSKFIDLAQLSQH